MTRKCINTAPRSTVWLESSPTRKGFLPRPSAGRRWSHRGLCKTSGHREVWSGQPHPLATRILTILAAHPQLVPTSNPGTQILRVTQKPPPSNKVSRLPVVQHFGVPIGGNKLEHIRKVLPIPAVIDSWWPRFPSSCPPRSSRILNEQFICGACV